MENSETYLPTPKEVCTELHLSMLANTPVRHLRTEIVKPPNTFTSMSPDAVRYARGEFMKFLKRKQKPGI